MSKLTPEIEAKVEAVRAVVKGQAILSGGECWNVEYKENVCLGADEEGYEYHGTQFAGAACEFRNITYSICVTLDGRFQVSLSNCEGEYWNDDYDNIQEALFCCISEFNK